MINIINENRITRLNSEMPYEYASPNKYSDLLNEAINDHDVPFLFDIFNVFNRSNINVEISNKTPSKTYKNKGYKFEDIIDSIKEKWDLSNRIDWLNKDNYLELVSIISRNYERSDERKSEKIRNVLDKLFKNIDIKFKSLILGQYSVKNKTIILYVNNIYKASIKNNISLDDYIKEVFVHELFHYYHYNFKFNNIELLSRSDYTSSIIKESLASYVEYMYAERKGLNTKNSLEQSWKEYPVTCYPYSGAINFLFDDYRDRVPENAFVFIHRRANFDNIFTKSLTNMDQALRDLLPLNDFYLVKNMDNKKTFTKKNIKKLLDSIDDD